MFAQVWCGHPWTIGSLRIVRVPRRLFGRAHGCERQIVLRSKHEPLGSRPLGETRCEALLRITPERTCVEAGAGEVAEAHHLQERHPELRLERSKSDACSVSACVD